MTPSGSLTNSARYGPSGFRSAPRRRQRIRVILLAGLLAVSAVLGTASASGHVHEAAPVERPAKAAPGYPWQWPVSGRRDVVVPFRAPAHDYGAGHRGMDIAAQPRTDVLSPAAGTVAFRGTVVDRPLITIDHGDGYVTTLEPVVSGRSPGDTVAAGDVVGAVATGGHAVRGTLHVGVRIDDRYVNPRGLFGSAPRAVLLPCCSP